MSTGLFHPLVAQWFTDKFGEPTEPQRRGWPAIAAGQNTLIAAPTGSGKTLSAFLVCLDRLFRQWLDGTLEQRTQVVYVSPLKALSNDIEKNLRQPLAEISELAASVGLGTPNIRVAVRTGDTPQSQRAAMLRKPPHILVTTPESLFLLLTSRRSREILRGARTLIVDEIHALARDKRGSHLTLTLERLAHLCEGPLTRIGLSATQRPMDQIARFLVGEPDCGLRNADCGLQEKDQADKERTSQPSLFIATAAKTIPTNPRSEIRDPQSPALAEPSDPASNFSPATITTTAGCTIIDVGHVRKLDLAVEVPQSELAAVCSNEQWGEIYQMLIELIGSHRSTLIFVNTRSLAERVAHYLTELLGEEGVASHHGSLSREIRLDAEQRLKEGKLKAIVATASLEMGIDIGYIDLVVQLGSPRSIATFLQRVGRAGHTLRAIPKGRLLPMTRDESMECLALMRAVRRGELDKIEIQHQPLDILAQQIIAAVAADEWNEDELFAMCKRAYPYRNLGRDQFADVLKLVCEGIRPNNKRGAWIYRDALSGRLKARRGARMAAITSGGAIPEKAEYRVVALPERTFVGSVDEDFAIDSSAGDIFLLGNTSWRIAAIRGGEVIVNDAEGAPPTIPFWFGEAPGRTIELSTELSVLREEIATRVAPYVNGTDGERREGGGERASFSPEPAAAASNPKGVASLSPGLTAAAGYPGSANAKGSINPNGVASKGVALDTTPLGLKGTTTLGTQGSDAAHPNPGLCDAIPSGLGLEDGEATPSSPLPPPPSALDAAADWVVAECNASPHAARQAARYVAAQYAAMGCVPTGKRIVFERFFDESGGMQLVVHAPLGARITRAWGLAFRKRFCRSFDFELQAAADDDGLLLSLGPQHSFPLDSMFKMLNRANAQSMLEQALLAVPMFQVRWRWNITRALAVLRWKNGKKVPPFLQKYQSEDLLAACFPETVGCLENHHGDVVIPDHPLVQQTMHDCLHEAMDITRWLEIFDGYQKGEIEFVACDTREPSPFSHEIINANPYAFLDGAPLEERRTRAVQLRRGLSIDDLRELGRLDPDAIRQVTTEAWPIARDADELHDALLSLGALNDQEEPSWNFLLEKLRAAGRATLVVRDEGPRLWIAAERQPAWQAILESIDLGEGRKVAFRFDPPIQLPPLLAQAPASAEAIVDLIRGRISHAGPTTASQLGLLLGLPSERVFAALEALEGEGFVLRGYFASLQKEATEVEWCDRRLLARIHRLTLGGLRKRIQPADPLDYMRFLVRHQRALPERHCDGPVGVREAIALLQGYESSAGTWERALLQARVKDFEPAWLDDLFLSGEVVWGRLRPPIRKEEDGPSSAGMTRTAPIALSLREDLAWLLPRERTEGIADCGSRTADSRASGSPASCDPIRNPQSAIRNPLRPNAAQIHDLLTQRGALFLQELRAASGLLGGYLEEALRELAAQGLVTCDGYSAVRIIVAGAPETGSNRKKPTLERSRSPSGRWSLFPGPVTSPSKAEYLERWCRQLLARYGVLFRDLLARESAAPAWFELVPVLRRMERKGEIRGGRFIAGVGGEQYALESAVGQLRALRDEPAEQTAEEPWVVLSAVDPLNLSGIVTLGSKVPATHKNAFILHRGRVLATKIAGAIEFREEVDPAERLEMERALKLLRRVPAKEHIRVRAVPAAS